MKVLHVGQLKTDRGVTGSCQSTNGFAVAQAGIGLKVGLIASSPLRHGELVEEQPEICVLGDCHRRHYNPWLVSRDWVDRIYEEFGTPDVVHFHSTYIPFNIAFARRCKQLGWPYIITPHGGMTYLAQNVKRIKKGVANFLFFRSYVKQAAAIHALCRREAEEIQALFEVKKIITVSNGVEDYLLEASEKLSAADLDDFGDKCDLMLGFVGRIDVYHKGLDLLLKAMAILKSQPDGFKCKLFFIGPFDPKKNKQVFGSVVESLRLKDIVKVLGPKFGDEKWRYFMACDVFVHTSRFEGMPMAVLEAMALGRPSLVTPGSNVANIVREGGGWECEPDPKSIAEAIRSIYEKRDSLRMIGQRSRELIQARFTWRNVAEQLSGEYAKVIE